MRYQIALALALGLSWGTSALGSLSEAEDNDLVTGTQLEEITPTFRVVNEIGSNLDPSLANPLPLNDSIVGQLGGTRDYDWYYVDVADSNRPVTPVYFGCDNKLGYYFETAPGESLTIDPKEVTFQVNYYYAPAAGITPTQQASFVVGPDSCKVGTAETVGHMRFQMNTQRPGRYYVRVFGRKIRDIEKKDTISGVNAQGQPVSVERTSVYSEIVTQTAAYNIRVYTAKVSGEQEPNDGSIEAVPLISGKAANGQLASQYDQDWFYIDNDAAVNTGRKIPFYFSCSGQTGATFNLEAYDQLNVQLASYKINDSQCSGAAGFTVTIDAPISARYYFVVSAPTYTDTATFSQGNYTVLALTSPAGGGGDDSSPETATRLPGQLEPNDTRVNAFPLTDTQAVTAQLSSAEDLDYYYYDNNSDTNRSGVTPIYFRCRSTSGIYVLSTFDTQGILQASYPIDSSQCNLPGGFTFNLSTPGTARYYVLVAGPADKSLDNTSSADYTISTFNNLAGDATDTFTGNLKRATIVDTVSAGNKDSFGVLLAQCGGKRGQVALAGNKLNLKGVDRNSQVQVKIGSWSCTSAAKALTEATSGNGARRLLLYPAPPAPTPSKRRGPQLSGGAG